MQYLFPSLPPNSFLLGVLSFGGFACTAPPFVHRSLISMLAKSKHTSFCRGFDSHGTTLTGFKLNRNLHVVIYGESKGD
ncbi:hypothetical protein L6452_17210 [Arctium lappa]|uniref:Uncharacterized protein n=1 Tax=Arctium lappa TaxID=4217 RepID=A0ACB9C2T6_ARCLA|nr:hypothetical protein L6452_17210 [Arctium lappa]